MSLAALSAHLTLRTATLVSYLADCMLHGYPIDAQRLGIDARDEASVATALPALLPPLAQLVRLPLSGLNPVLLKLRPLLREECSRDSTLLILNQWIQARIVEHCQAQHTSGSSSSSMVDVNHAVASDVFSRLPSSSCSSATSDPASTIVAGKRSASCALAEAGSGKKQRAESDDKQTAAQ